MNIGKNVYIAPTVWMDNDISIGDRSRIYQGTIIKKGFKMGHDGILGNLIGTEFDVTIGNHTTICSQSHLTMEIIIEDWVFFGPGVITTNTRNIVHGRNRDLIISAPFVKRGSAVGGGSVLTPGVVIGEGAIIGAGSVVTKDVPNYEIWVGNPARFLRVVDNDDKIDFDKKQQECNNCIEYRKT